jgi:hypothetical protein
MPSHAVGLADCRTRQARPATHAHGTIVFALCLAVAGPLALLVLFQFQFLPYHDEEIAWWQRIAVVIDVVLLWALWPSVARGEWTPFRSLNLRRWPIVTALLSSLAPILLVCTIATFPGELLDMARPIRFVPTSKGWTSIHELLVGGAVDRVARKPTSLWSNRLVLPGIDMDRLGHTPRYRLRGSRPARGRHEGRFRSEAPTPDRRNERSQHDCRRYPASR